MKNYLSLLMPTLLLAMNRIVATAKSEADTNNTLTNYLTLKKLMTASIDDQMRRNKMPSLEIAIVDDQRIIRRDAFG